MMSSVVRGRWLVAVTAVVLCAAAVLGVQRYRRAREWAHGGDAVTMSVRSQVADARQLPAAAAALGYRDQAVLTDGFAQGIAVRVEWHGPASHNARYELVALDRRVRPPRPLRVYGGWNVDGGTGSNWASSYRALADHYDWLAGTAPTDTGPGWVFPAQAVDAPATATGSVTGIFLVDDQAVPFTGTADVMVAVFLVDGHGEPRWARRVSG